MITNDEPGEHAVTWISLRRVHFYINDLIMRDVEAFGVGVQERRIFDYLDYASSRTGEDGAAVALLCELIPTRPKAQTTLSVLMRMQEYGWVIKLPTKSTGTHRGHLWQLTELGRHIRDSYRGVAEAVLQEIYSDASEQQTETLLEHCRAALMFMDRELGSVIDVSRIDASDLKRRWEVLRTTHFYLNDLIFARAEPIGVDAQVRRVLDYLAFAEHRGRSDGITSETLWRLMPNRPRRRATTATLEKMMGSGLTTFSPASASKGSRKWRLTDKGRQTRSIHKQYAESTIRTIYQKVGDIDGQSLLQLARSAEGHGNARLVPVVRYSPNENPLHCERKPMT